MTNRGRYLALAAALLGWMFDGMEMGLFPLVARSALGELLHVDEQHATASALGALVATVESQRLETEVARWFAVVTAAFLIGAATGGVLFGWLGDKIGRVRAMTLSVLMYSLCSGLSALSAEPWHLAGLRFVGALGMGGEWALGVALVMEVWPGTSRGLMAGLIGAAGNLGYTICAVVALALNRYGGELPTWTGAGNWRLLMLVGAGPAVLTTLIRLFVPESEKWERESGKASHWSGMDLLGVLVGAVAAGGVVYLWAQPFGTEVRVGGSLLGLCAVVVGYLFPARQYLVRSGISVAHRRHLLGRMLLAAGLSGVPLLGTWSGVMWMYQWVGKLPGGTDPDARPLLQVSSSVGAALGCVVAALLGGRLGRRWVYALLCVASAATILGFYRLNTAYGPEMIASAGLLGFVTASFYGWLPLYLPELFPTAVRATGQGFGFNFGRILAAAGNLQLPVLLAAFENDYAKACAVVPLVYAGGLVLIYFAPETKGRPLPD